MKWLKKLNEILKLKSLLLTTAVIIVFVTTYALVLPAITMERKTYCGMEEHTHSDDCYTVTSTLICGQEESEGHTHTDDCYAEEKVLVCELEENEEHTHGDDCYEITRELICGQEESEGHTHTDACYETEKELTCGMEEHTHTDECYVDPDAPEETEPEETQPTEETGKAADTTEASEEQEMTEAAAETESDEETEEETETAAEEIAYPAVVLTQQILEAEPDENGQPVSWIDVEIDAPEGALPEGATFALKQYIPEEKYQAEFDEELDNTVEGGILEHKTVAISFFDAAGEPVVPAADVQVFIRDGLIRDAENVELVKIDDTYPDDLRTELVKLDPKANEKTDEDVITYTLTPEDPAVLSVVSTTLKKTLKAEGEDYTITVSCSAKAGIPEGSTLQVKEIIQDTSDYQGLVSDTEKALDVNEGNVAYARFFDITIVDPMGWEIQPKEPVDVKINLNDLQENAPEEEKPQVVHFGDEPETVDAKQKGDAVSFEAEGFSVYGVVYTVDFKWEVNGKEYEYSLQGGDSISFNALADALNILSDKTAEEKEQFLSEIEEISFSDPELLWTGKLDEDKTAAQIASANDLDVQYSRELTDKQIDDMKGKAYSAGEWVLLTVRPFLTEETLTVKMIGGDSFTVKVTDAQIRREDLEDGVGYIIFTTDSSGKYYVLKTDGSTERFDNADGFDDFSNDYKWTFTYVYVEDGVERFNIHPISDRTHSLSLNNPGQSLLGSGPNNITIVPIQDSNGYTFGGYNNTKLNFVQDGDNKIFVGAAGEDSAAVYIYAQNSLDNYKFNVSSNDTKKGDVSGINNVGSTINNASEYTAITTSDKKNQNTIKAEVKSNKYIFDHWELNGSTLYVTAQDGTQTLVGSTINPGEIDIPYNMSTLEAVFKLNPNYNPPDSEKEGQGFDTASKAKLEQWLEDLKKKQVPLDPNGCDKTAEVYDYENRIYRVDLTAKSNLTTFDGTVDLGFIIDASGSMQFPSKLSAEAGKQEIDINHINDNDTNKAWLDQSKYHYLIADKAGTATVYRLFYASYQEQTWYGTVTRTGWYAVDSSYADSDSRRFLIGSNSRFSNDAAGTHYQIYEDGDLKKDENGNQIYLDNGQPAGYKRLDYLQSSINGTVSELNSILGTLALAKNSTKNPDVQVAYNTFCATILHQQHSFSSVKNGFNIQWDTNGGTGTDLALHDAESFNWGQNNTTKNYAVLITDGAPQSGGRAIDNATVIAAANELKKGPDNTAGTADDVTLITVGLSMGDVKRGSVLLYDLADRDSDNEKMFFKAETGDELEYALYGIIQKILIDANVQGDVTDKVGEAFYPVDKNTGIPLKAGDEIDLDGNVVTGDTSYTGPRGVLGSDLQTFTWTDQEFTHEGWHGTVYVKAKEDFLGGNAVRTNEGNASIQAKTYKTPSMTQPVELREKKTDGTDTNYILEVNDLESPLVNVNEHQFSETDTEWTVYLGTEVNPEKQLEALYRLLYIEEVVTKAVDLEPAGNLDNLPDHVLYADGDTDNNLYPLTQSISDKRESEIQNGKVPVTFTLNDLLKKLVNGKNYTWWDYEKGEPKFREFFVAASTGEGIVLDYDEYGLDDKEHQLDNNTTKHDGSTITLKLVKTIAEGEIEAGVDPLDGLHATRVTGDAVEKYTFTAFYTPDYEILPEGQGGKSIEDFHVGSYGTMYNGHAAGTETLTKEHTINVYAEPLDVKKVDPDGKTLPGAKFAVYRKAETGETGVPLSTYNDTLTDSYILISEATSDANGIARLANTGNTAATRLVPGVVYYLIEAEVPGGGYVRDSSVRIVTVQTQTDGSFTDLNGLTIQQTVTNDEGNETQVPLTDISTYEGPYNWSQGVKILVDGKAAIEIQGHEYVLGENEYLTKQEASLFRTKIVNEKAVTDLLVTKKWTDEKGVNKASADHSITFTLKKKNPTTNEVTVVDARGVLESADGVAVNEDGTSITLTYNESTGWPTAHFTELLKYTDDSGKAEWIYFVEETICNPSDAVNPNNAAYEESAESNHKKITIVNIEKRKTQIKVDKQWLNANGQTLSTAPESKVKYEIYRMAHIPCIHVWDEGQITTEPSCEGTGVKTYSCTKCDETKTETLSALGHSWSEWKIVKAPTYTEDGLAERICSRCEKHETRTITKLAHEHVWEDIVTVTEPTCTETGTAHRRCSLCMALSEDTIVIPALGHDWDDGVTTKNPTCTETGTKKFTCSRCGATEDRDIAALGHDYEYTIVYDDNTDPEHICTPAGQRIGTCRNDSSHTTTESIAAIPHEYSEVWESYKEATETEDGENRAYCIHGCGRYISQVVPKTGETFGETGLPVSQYNWPDTSNFTAEELNKNTSIKADGTIIKCTVNGVESYAIFYSNWSGNYHQLAEGPTSDNFRNCSVILTDNPVLTSADIRNNTINPISRGDLYETADGEYYVFIAWNESANNLHNGDTSVKSSNEWFHIVKPAPSTTNTTNSTNSASPRNTLRMMSAPAMLRSMKAMNGVAANGASANSGDGDVQQSEEDPLTTERRNRLAALLNKTAAEIVFRSELGEQSGVDAWEYVGYKENSGDSDGSWHWDLNDLPAFDDDGNEYSYYVVETFPSAQIYEISYDNNGVKDSSTNKTIIIKNKQIIGSLSVTKSVDGDDAKGTYKIAVKDSAGHYYDTDGADKGTTAFYVEFTKDQTKTWTNLPTGTYTVEEEDASVAGYTWTVSGEGNVTVNAGGTASATVVNHYQHSDVEINVIKIDETTRNAATQKTLENAGFKLYKLTTVEGQESKYTVYPDEANCEKFTGPDGSLKFDNLTVGKYMLEETQAPEGYVKHQDLKIYFSFTGGTSITWTDANNTAISSQDMVSYDLDSKTFTVGNTPGKALPSTGGPGRKPLYLLGSLLLLLGTAGFLLRRRTVR